MYIYTYTLLCNNILPMEIVEQVTKKEPGSIRNGMAKKKKKKKKRTRTNITEMGMVLQWAREYNIRIE
jgi:hypothetical protein